MASRLAALLALLTLAPAIAQAQLWEDLKQREPEAVATAQTDFWTRTLGLNAQQSTAVQAINLSHAASSTQVAKGPGTDAQKRAALRAAEAEKADEISAVLTSAQRERYLAIVQQLNELAEPAGP